MSARREENVPSDWGSHGAACATHRPRPGLPGVTDTNGTPGTGTEMLPGWQILSLLPAGTGRAALGNPAPKQICVSRKSCLSLKVALEGCFAPWISVVIFWILKQGASVPALQIIHKGVFPSASFELAACPGLLLFKPKHAPFCACFQCKSLPNRIKP